MSVFMREHIPCIYLYRVYSARVIYRYVLLDVAERDAFFILDIDGLFLFPSLFRLHFRSFIVVREVDCCYFQLGVVDVRFKYIIYYINFQDKKVSLFIVIFHKIDLRDPCIFLKTVIYLEELSKSNLSTKSLITYKNAKRRKRNVSYIDGKRTVIIMIFISE